MLDRLVNVVASGSSAPALARWLLDKLGVDHTGANPVRYLLEAVFIDVYFANPEHARTWLSEWGTNVQRTTLTADQLATRLVVAVVATLGLPDQPTALGGWFGAWCKPKPRGLFANETILALHDLATSLVRRRAQASGEGSSAAQPAPGDVSGPTASAPESHPAVDLSALSETTMRALWPQVVELFPKAAPWADKPTSHLARGFMASFAAEKPSVVAKALRQQTEAGTDPLSPLVAGRPGELSLTH